ncbi:MAG: ATP-binding protein, partial [Oscillospiraceae bacterium]|nr:ATP-binding protein [Oscillospiraceae bacterium]
MSGERFLDTLKRKTIVTGHYGSGKTEFAVSLALQLKQEKLRLFSKMAIIDLDIVNPYFRSREQREMLENAGIAVYGSAYENEVTLELPALGATVRTPLEDKSCKTIIDLGGNDSGALIINQFTKYFTDDDTSIIAI